jgi:hypothetical protein
MFLALSSRWFLGDGPEHIERLGPESVEITAQRFQTDRVHRVNTPSAFGVVRDKAGVLEHTQVLRYGGAADWEIVCQLTY